MIPLELFVGAWLMTKGGWSTVWMAFVGIVVIEVALVALRVFTGIDIGLMVSSTARSLVFMIFSGGSQ